MATTAGRITHVAQALLRRSPPGGLSPGPAPDSRASGLATLRPKLDGAWREGARATPPRRRHLPPVSGPRRPENSFGDGTADATRRASLSRLWSEVAAAPPRVAHAGRGRAATGAQGWANQSSRRRAPRAGPPRPSSLRKGARARPGQSAEPDGARGFRDGGRLPRAPAFALPSGGKPGCSPPRRRPPPRAPTAPARLPARGRWSERGGSGGMLALLAAGVALAMAAGAQDGPAPSNRFVCTALPPEAARAGCPLPAMPMQGGALSPEEELRAAVLQLRETVVQQKETLGSQREAIRELTAKLARCEGLAGGKAPGRGASGKDTMGDLPRDPGHVVEQLSRSLQTLKDRLESLEHQLRANVSSAVLPGDFREVLQRRLGELERQLLRKVAELEDEKSLLHNETSAHRQKTESALNALLQRVTELERGNSAFKSPDAFKVSLPLRTNYLYGKIKKTLPELYAFTICLWLRSSASPGIGTPFSYAVPGQANEIVLIEWGNNPIELLINDKVAQLPLFVSDGKWHHICVTWTTRDGMWEAFQDGEKLGTGENLAPWHPIKPGGVLILGQEQDTVGGRFDATQAFVGELSQFNIWDRVLRAQEIINIANCSTNMPGNIIPWVDNNVDVFGGASKWPVETCEERLLDL
ncbi:hypothetical protein AB1E18_017965 [Capra hircus]